MDNEQQVKAKYPEARITYQPLIACWKVFYDVQDSAIYGHEEDIGFGETEAEAWLDAARKLEESQ